MLQLTDEPPNVVVEEQEAAPEPQQGPVSFINSN